MAVDKRTRCPVTDYATKVTKGIIPAGKLVKLACQRHLDDVKAAKTRGLCFDREKADHAIRKIQLLRHSKGEWAGKNVILSDWQVFIVGCLFGWLRADGTRRFREAYIEVARKNGKSTLLAAIAIYMLFWDNEPGAEIYIAATKEDQAKIIFDEATNMLLKVPKGWAIRKNSEILKKCIAVPLTASKMKPLGSDSETQDGLNPHMCAIDELHAHKTRDLYDVLDTAIGARRQPLIICITTSGHNRHSICYDKHTYGRNVVEKRLPDDSFFVYIAALDDKDDWKVETNWPKANPNLGISVKMDDLRRLYTKAIASPAAQNTFKQKRLNIWTESAERWLDAEVYDRLAENYTLDDLKGRICYGGLDLSSTQDLTAFDLVFPPVAEGERWNGLSLFWIPAENIKKRMDKDKVPYELWVQQGFIAKTEGNVIDYNVVQRDIVKFCSNFVVKEIAYDRFNATQIVTNLGGEGLNMVQFGQGYVSMSAPTKFYEDLIVGGKFAHDGNPVLNWMMGNVQISEDAAGNKKPDKAKSTEKIDGVVARVMGIGRAIVAPIAFKSVYATRGLINT